MDCARSSHGVDTCSQWLQYEGLLVELAQRVSERQAAVAYLEAARLTDDAVERERLRRLGAELVWPGRRPSLFAGPV
jgi:hypothetical protein